MDFAAAGYQIITVSPPSRISSLPMEKRPSGMGRCGTAAKLKMGEMTSTRANLRMVLRRLEVGDVSAGGQGLFGGPGRDRTDDLFHAMEARSQLRHRPTIRGHYEQSVADGFNHSR